MAEGGDVGGEAGLDEAGAGAVWSDVGAGGEGVVAGSWAGDAVVNGELVEETAAGSWMDNALHIHWAGVRLGANPSGEGGEGDFGGRLSGHGG